MSLQPFADDIRKDLLETLSRPDIDYDRLVKLTSEMAKQDPNNVRFAVDAGIISRLGRELVAKQETAVAELVKNAYDADATKVELVFSNTDFPGGSLTVTDNGTGMDRQELVDGFMRLSSTTKVREPVSRVYKRIRAGRKGIGRFAAQRLGNQLTIITQTLDADKALKVEIDWSEFQPDRDLATVSNSLAEADKKQAQGTQLVIQGLHERWTTASIERVFRYVSDLLQPYPLSTRGQWISGSEAHFEPVLYRNENGVLQEVANLSTEIYDLAIAVFEGVVDNEGHALWSVKSNKLNIDETEQLGKSRDDSSSPYNHLRNVSLKAYYFLLKPAPYLSSMQNRVARDFLSQHGGIRIYRNGFRVRPYGEPGDDWVGVDASARRRTFLFPHANPNFFGFVELLDSEGIQYEETSSREGLIENQAFDELREFVYGVLLSGAGRVASFREKKTTSGQRKSGSNLSASEQIGEIADRLDSLIQSVANANSVKTGAADKVVDDSGTTSESKDTHISDSDSPEAVINQMLVLVGDVAEKLRNVQTQTNELIQEMGMLRVLASMGLTIAEFTHELRHRFFAILADVRYFEQLHADNPNHSDAVKTLLENLEVIHVFMSYFGSAVDENENRLLRHQDVSLVLRQFTKTMRTAAAKYKITIPEPDICGFDLITLPMHASEWSSILFNLFTNSRKAIQRTGKPGEVAISAGKAAGMIYLEFSDTGDGISVEVRDRIFDPFFTTTSPASPHAPDSEELLGTGLGLTIIRDIITGYGGEIFLKDAIEPYSTCFRIEIPAASEEEIEDFYDS